MEQRIGAQVAAPSLDGRISIYPSESDASRLLMEGQIVRTVE